MAINLNEANFTEHTAKGAVLVDFWAAWCGPCQAVLPIMDELSKDFEGRASICKVNVDEERALARQYGVSSIPTILLMKDGQVVERIVGAQSKSVFETKLNALLMSKRFKQSLDTLGDVAFKSLKERILKFLHANAQNGVVRTSQENIASNIGSAREAVAKVLKELKNEGFIDTRRGEILLKSKGA